VSPTPGRPGGPKPGGPLGPQGPGKPSSATQGPGYQPPSRTQSNAVTNQGPPPKPAGHSPPQSAVVNQPSPSPRSSGGSPPQQQQKCQVINGQQVCK